MLQSLKIQISNDATDVVKTVDGEYRAIPIQNEETRGEDMKEKKFQSMLVRSVPAGSKD